MKKDYLSDFLTFRDEAMAKALDALTDAKVSFQLRLEDYSQGLKDYISSEEFERDLDRLAARLGADDERYRQFEGEERSQRARLKAKHLLLRARHQVVQSAEVGGAFAFLSRKSRFVFAATVVCAGFKGAEVAFECYQVFAPALRRRSLRVV
jgi:hypothetical protein